jgi:putative addiction module CopG family antidote
VNVHLDPQSERLIEEQLRAGRYRSSEEVVARALETLAGRESTGAE